MVPQWVLLADIEAAEALDAYEQATESGTKAAKLNLSAVEAICVKAMAAKPDAESARQLAYAWALALEARGQATEAVKQYQSVAQDAPEPWRSEVLYRAGAAALSKDSGGALASWSQVTAMPYVVYAGYRQVTELVRTGACPAAGDALAKLKSAPALQPAPSRAAKPRARSSPLVLTFFNIIGWFTRLGDR
jgi:tetratricopeptide (TPR) repeat protein